MNNTIIYLLGHYGVGKLTVAKAICAASGARLFDNHVVNNVLFSLVRADGRTPLPEAIWDDIGRIRQIAFEAIDKYGHPEDSYVLTNALTDDPADRAWFDAAAELARRRKARFLPVQLVVDEDEHARRINTPERAANLKHTDVGSGLARRRSVRLLPIVHPNFIELDITQLPPADAARLIISHAERLAL
jgi:hypothetical protein